jgi:hypothetical protein
VSFFDRPPPRPERVAPRTATAFPPEDELGGPADVHVVLAHAPDFALALLNVVAYSTGFAFDLALRTKPGSRRETATLWQQMRPPPGREHWGDDTDARTELRLGFEFADGRRATRFAYAPDGEPITLAPGGGGGGDHAFMHRYHLPLPPPGPLLLVVEWPRAGIELTTHELDAAPILEAAARSRRFWD